MNGFEKGKLLRIYIEETDRYHGKPLYEQIVLRAREFGLSGATVLRGLMGYGAHSHLHTAKLLRFSETLPVVVEIVDTEERLEEFYPLLDEMVNNGLVTVESVELRRYRRDGKRNEAE